MPDRDQRAPRWFIAVADGEQGPFGFNEMRARFLDGRLLRGSLVCLEASDVWQRLDQSDLRCLIAPPGQARSRYVTPTVSPFRAVRRFYANYGVLSGRATRQEFWYGHLFAVLISIVLGVIFAAQSYPRFPQPEDISFQLLSFVSLVLLGIPIWTLTVRRMHDIGMSGFWLLVVTLLASLPYIGLLFSLGVYVLACFPSEEDENFYDLNRSGPIRSPIRWYRRLIAPAVPQT